MKHNRIFIIANIFVFLFVILWIGQSSLIRADYVISKEFTAQNTNKNVLYWDKITELFGETGDAGDHLGMSVAASNNFAIAGAYLDDSGGIDAGSAYIFEQTPSGWVERDKILAQDHSPDSYFGYTVSIDGDTAVIGAYGESELGFEAGAAYVFVRSGNDWIQQAKLLANDGALGDRFGESVAISGNTIVVGAHWDDDHGRNSGSAYVFVRDGNSWTQQAKLSTPDGNTEDSFGRAVAISGDTIVVSAFYDDDLGFNSGSVHVFERSGTIWTRQPKLLASDGGVTDEFGTNVAIDGNTFLVSAARDDDMGADAGAFYVFVHDGIEWKEHSKLRAPGSGAGDRLSAVDINGNIAIIGAWGDDDSGSNSGAAYVFERNGTSWAFHSKLSAPDGASEDLFGRSVAIANNSLIVGADSDDSHDIDAGAVYFFGPSYPADVAIEKQITNHIAAPDQSITYTLHYTNYGPDIAVNTIITDLIPTEITDLAFSNSGPIITQTGSAPFAWEIAPLLPNESGTITITGVISSDLTVDTMITNTAVISNRLDITPTNNIDTAVVQVIIPKADVSIHKSASVSLASPNEPITYTLTYTNNGPGIAYNTLITDIMPSTLDSLSVSHSGPMITPTGVTSFSWEVAPLALNESGTITISGVISPDITIDTVITNTAVISNRLDITPTNNVDTAVIQVITPKYVYLPTILKPAPLSFPIQIGGIIPTVPTDQGAVFYTTTIAMPETIPATGKFFLSSQPDSLSAILVDDELVLSLNGNELFTHNFSPDCQPLQEEIVSLPRNIVDQLNGESVTFSYRDTCGNEVQASAVWLIWVP